jgi:hypothetical protein
MGEDNTERWQVPAHGATKGERVHKGHSVVASLATPAHAARGSCVLGWKFPANFAPSTQITTVTQREIGVTTLAQLCFPEISVTTQSVQRNAGLLQRHARRMHRNTRDQMVITLRCFNGPCVCRASTRPREEPETHIEIATKCA